MDFLNVTEGQCFNEDLFSPSLAESGDSSSYFGGRLATAGFCAGAVIMSRIVSHVYYRYGFDLPRNIQRPLQITLYPCLIADKVLMSLFDRTIGTIGSCLGVFRRCYRARQAKQFIQRNFPDLIDSNVKLAEVWDQKAELATELFGGAVYSPSFVGAGALLLVGNRVERHTVSTFSLELKRMKYLCLQVLGEDRSSVSVILRGSNTPNALWLSEINKRIKAYNGLISKIDDLLISAETIQRQLESGEEVTTSSFESKYEAFVKEVKGCPHEESDSSSPLALEFQLPKLLNKLVYEPSYRVGDILDTATNMNNDQRKNIERRVRDVEFSAHRLRHMHGAFNRFMGGIKNLIETGRMQELVQLHRDCMRESDPLARCMIFKKHMAHNIDGYKGCLLDLIRLHFYGDEHAGVRNRLTTGLSEIFEHLETEMSDLNLEHLQYNPSPEEYFRRVRIAMEDNWHKPIRDFSQENPEFHELGMQSGQDSTERDHLGNRLESLGTYFDILISGVTIQGAQDRNFIKDLVFQPTRGKEDFDRERGYLEDLEPAEVGG